jgi:branched-chain amino acid transport system substrate-binding protein
MTKAMLRRRGFLGGLPALASPFLASRALAQGGIPTVRIGVLWDRSGAGAVTSGLDQIVAARLAVDDFGQFSRGYPIDLVDAEFERRPDAAGDIARKWFEHDNVAAIVDVPGTAAPVRVQELARTHNRTVMNTSSFNSALTGRSCSPTATHWMEDTRALTRAMTVGLAAEGIKTWFLVVPDDVVGSAFQTDATAAIESLGGRVLGFAQHPADAETFAPALASARDSGADAIGLCAVGPPLAAQIRQARAAGLFDKSKAVCAYAASIKDIQAMGPRETSDLFVVTGFYWNQNDRTRAFAHRFNDLTRRMPDKPYAATYAAVGDFLRIVETSDTIDGAAVNVGLRREPVYFFGSNGRLLVDGTLLLDVGLYRVKPPEQVTEEWDYYKLVRMISATDVFRPLPRGTCPLLP